MRCNDQTVDLLFAIVGERKHRPVVAGLAAAHLDAADNAVGAGRGRNLDTVIVGALQFDGVGEINRRRIATHIDGLDGAGARDAESRHTCESRERDSRAKK